MSSQVTLSSSGVSSTRAFFPRASFSAVCFCSPARFGEIDVLGKVSAPANRARILRWFPTLAPSRVHLHDAPEKSVSTIHGRGDDCEGVFKRSSLVCNSVNSCRDRSSRPEDLRLAQRNGLLSSNIPFSRFLKKPGPFPPHEIPTVALVGRRTQKSQSGASRGILRWRRSRRANRPRLTYTSCYVTACAMTSTSKAYEPIPPEYLR